MRRTIWDTPAVAKRRTPAPLPDSVRDAVERTVQATVGTRDRAQEAVDDMVGTLEARGKAVTDRVREAFEERRPVTLDDIRELRTELRAIARRLESIEERLPAKRSSARRKPAAGKSAAKKPAAKRGSARRGSAKRSS
jgi:hypothetical protein